MGSMLLGSRWRRRLRQIKTQGPDLIEQRALSNLLGHSLAHVPFYRNLEIPEPHLNEFPLLARSVLRMQYESMRRDDVSGSGWRRVSTGGSTGEPVWVIQDREFLGWERATEIYWLEEFCGMTAFEYLSSRRVAIWHRRRAGVRANPFVRLAGYLLRQVLYVEPYAILTETMLNEHVRRINKHSPSVVLAFAGTAFEIAKHAQRLGLTLHRPRFIITGVEMLYPAMRETIEAAFGCPVYDRYGSAETGIIAAECSRGKHHVFSFAHVVEVLDDENRTVQPGQVGRIVVTPLHNLAMPLIRYEIGDLARTSADVCDCGSPLPVWEEIVGRVIHNFVRADGSVVFGGSLIAMFYEYDWVLQLNVLQLDIDKVVISYRRTPGHAVPPSDIGALTQATRNILGEGCVVLWEEVDVIPNSPIGKHLHARSLVWEERVGEQRG